MSCIFVNIVTMRYSFELEKSLVSLLDSRTVPSNIASVLCFISSTTLSLSSTVLDSSFTALSPFSTEKLN